MLQANKPHKHQTRQSILNINTQLYMCIHKKKKKLIMNVFMNLKRKKKIEKNFLIGMFYEGWKNEI